MVGWVSSVVHLDIVHLYHKGWWDGLVHLFQQGVGCNTRDGWIVHLYHKGWWDGLVHLFHKGWWDGLVHL